MISARPSYTCLILLPLMLCCPWLIPQTHASLDEARTSKSELLYNLALLSQTPNRPRQEIYTVCAFEEDIGHLKATSLESQKLQQSQIFLVTLKTQADVKRCNLLYIQDVISQKPLELQQIIQKESVLTVVHQGNKFAEFGHVEISEQEKRYQFVLHLGSAKQAGIVFDSRLIKLANNLIQ